MKVVKNYLDKDYFNKLKSVFVEGIDGSKLPFYLQRTVAHKTNEKSLEHFYFTHLFYDHAIMSDFYELVKPIIWDTLKAKALIRARLNLYPRTDTLLHHYPHTDHEFKHKALVLSLNTCDGGTRVGKEFIPSIENQAFFFDASIPHNSTTCTNQHARINLNFNYF